MQIQSVSLCRAEGKVYEKLRLTGLTPGDRIITRWDPTRPAAAIPARIFALDSTGNAGSTSWVQAIRNQAHLSSSQVGTFRLPGVYAEDSSLEVVVVFPDSPTAEGLGYEIAAVPSVAVDANSADSETNPAEATTSTASHHATSNAAPAPYSVANVQVDFGANVWRSRRNYKLRRNEVNAFRLADERQKDRELASIDVVEMIPGHKRGRLRLRHSYLAAAERPVEIVCVDNAFSPRKTLPTVPMGATHSRPAPHATAGLTQFVATTSTRVPYFIDRLTWVLVDTETREVLTFRQIFRGEMDAWLDAVKDDQRGADIDPNYANWFHNWHRATPTQLAMQRATVLDNNPTFGLVVPVFNPPMEVFQEMVDSVLAQTYGHWELMLVNASPENKEISSEIDRLVASDPRIRTTTCENQGIWLNSRAGFDLLETDYISFFDHDDLLEPDLLFEYASAVNNDPLIDLLYCDEDKIDMKHFLFHPFLKPDFSIDLLRHENYICHMLTVRTSLLKSLDINTTRYDGAQDHHLTLMVAEKSQHIHHVAKILYHWRAMPGSTAVGVSAKSYARIAGVNAVRDHLERLGIEATVTNDMGFCYDTYYHPPASQPKVSIIIPTSDHSDLLRRCVESIAAATTYPNWDIVLVDNNSTDPATPETYRSLEAQFPGRITTVHYDGTFNFSAIVNYGVAHSDGEYILLLNNDTEVRTTDHWLERLVGMASRPELGAVGTRLLYPDDVVQHAGVVLTVSEAFHYFAGQPSDKPGYCSFDKLRRNVSAVTAACMMVRREVFDEVGEFDESFEVAYNDVDFCLRLRDAGYLIAYEPKVELTHYESISRGMDETPERKARYFSEWSRMFSRWSHVFAAGDPYYTPHAIQGDRRAAYYRLP